MEIAEIDRQIEHNNIRDEFRRQALECQWNGGWMGNVLTICGPTTRAACLMRKSRRSSGDAQRLWKGVQASRQASNQNALAQQLAKQQAEREQIAAVIKKRNTYLQLERKVAILESTLGNWQGARGKDCPPCWLAARSCGRARA